MAQLRYRRGLGKETPPETRYYIFSHRATAKSLLQATRDHWGIENSLHWCWIWPSAKTVAESEPAMPTRTWR